MSFFDHIPDSSYEYQAANNLDNMENTSNESVMSNNDVSETTYEVQDGDSLWKIAEEVYGDGTQWTKIYEANQDTIGNNPDLIFSGQNFVIPESSDVTSDMTNEIVSNNMATEGMHEVQPGDNLWQIAEQFYGDGTQWTRIYEANQGIIGDNPDLIYPGQDLVIPGFDEPMETEGTETISSEGDWEETSFDYDNFTDDTYAQNDFNFENLDLQDLVQIGAIAGDTLKGINALQDILNTEDDGSNIEEVSRFLEGFTDAADGMMGFS